MYGDKAMLNWYVSSAVPTVDCDETISYSCSLKPPVLDIHDVKRQLMLEIHHLNFIVLKSQEKLMQIESLCSMIL